MVEFYTLYFSAGLCIATWVLTEQDEDEREFVLEDENFGALVLVFVLCWPLFLVGEITRKR
jgi:hypothetical protein